MSEKEKPAPEPVAEEPAGDPEPRGDAIEPVDPRFSGEEYEARQLSEDE